MSEDLEQDEDSRRPCCCYKTLDARNMYKICLVCFWEDDGQDDHDAHVV